MSTEYNGLDDRPWEKPGAQRRDCLPHRAGLLELLGTATSLLMFLTFCTGGIGGLLAIALAVVVRVIAGRDVAMIEAGLMDRRSTIRIHNAKELAGVQMVVTAWFLAIWLIIITALASSWREFAFGSRV